MARGPCGHRDGSAQAVGDDRGNGAGRDRVGRRPVPAQAKALLAKVPRGGELLRSRGRGIEPPHTGTSSLPGSRTRCVWATRRRRQAGGAAGRPLRPDGELTEVRAAAPARPVAAKASIGPTRSRDLGRGFDLTVAGAFLVQPSNHRTADAVSPRRRIAPKPTGESFREPHRCASR